MRGEEVSREEDPSEEYVLEKWNQNRDKGVKGEGDRGGKERGGNHVGGDGKYFRMEGREEKFGFHRVCFRLEDPPCTGVV